MPEQTESAEFIKAAFRAWRNAGLNFLVLRNYAELPASTSNDIDVLVQPRDLKKAEELLGQAAAQTGFRLHNRAEFVPVALYYSSLISNLQVHFDVFTSIAWRGLEFASTSLFLSRKRELELFPVPHPADEAVCDLLSFLLHTGRVKEKYKELIAENFRTHGKEALECLSPICGRSLAEFMVTAGAREDWGEIERKAGRLRQALATRQVTRHPLRTMGSLVRDAVRLTRRFAHTPGMLVALCGPDGCGKTTAAASILEPLGVSYSPEKHAHYHWKPPMFSAARRAARTAATDPHAEEPRSLVLSLFYFGFHWLEFVLGYWLRVRPITFRGGLVLIDRYFYDFLVDQRRYRLQLPKAFVRLACIALPEPDLVLILDAPGEVLQSRKNEVPPAESERQRQAYLAIAKTIPRCRVINAAQAPGRVASDIVAAVLEQAAGKLNGRLRPSPVRPTGCL